MIPDKDLLKLYNKSKKTMGQEKFNPNYDSDDHCLWVSQYNRGVSHVGIKLSLLPHSNIKCNVFHYGCTIGKRLMNYLQGFLLRQSRSFQA